MNPCITCGEFECHTETCPYYKHQKEIANNKREQERKILKKICNCNKCRNHV